MNEPFFPRGQEPAEPRSHDFLNRREHQKQTTRRIRIVAWTFILIGGMLSIIGAVSIFSTYGQLIQSLDSVDASSQP